MATDTAPQQPDLPRTNTKSPQCVLPPEKVFSIQVGTELFRLSGASIASDGPGAPSYFSHFFEDQLRQSGDGSNIRTLYIDRDPDTFRDIAQHLQGYHVQPKDGAQFVKLFADAQFYSLPRLTSQIFESDIFIQIGARHFQIPRDIFSGPGDSPNFFSLGFAAFFASPGEVFPGLNRSSLLRPPAIVPPCVPHRSGDVFADLLLILRGYPLHIRDKDHRASLLRDCRYFHLRGLEQKLIPHHISFNPVRGRSEIVLRLEDVRPSGVHFASDGPATPSEGWVLYARPFVDDKPAELIVEVVDETMEITPRACSGRFFASSATARASSLCQVVANKLGLHPTESLGWKVDDGEEEQNLSSSTSARARIDIPEDADLTVDGEPTAREAISASAAAAPADSASEPPAKRKRVSDADRGGWIVRTGQWRLRVRHNTAGDRPEMVFVAVKLDVYTKERMRNKARGFLG
ncbi:domain containing protein [Aspergillus sp. HF37]|nr:domain containing protein [Aspergillus sp. HF37]